MQVPFSGAEGETRTLAPVSRPTPLAGAPRHQLEYFCIGSVYDTIRLLKERAENPLSLLSGGESGIRTHGTLPYGSFQDCFLKPLGHLSSWALAHAVPNAYLIYQIFAVLSSLNFNFFRHSRRPPPIDNLFLAKPSFFSLQKHLFVVQ